MSKRTKSLRSQVDNSFVYGGSQMVKARQHKHNTPDWVNNKSKIRRLLLAVFPKLQTDENQREGASRWARIIQLYFRVGYTRKQVSEEMSLTSAQVKGVIQGIRNVSEGRRADGRGIRKGSRGRPRKDVPTV